MRIANLVTLTGPWTISQEPYESLRQPKFNSQSREVCSVGVSPPLESVSTPSTPESSPPIDQTRWFSEEVHPHDSSLKAYLRRSFPAIRDVDDVVQESYLRIWKRQTAKPIESAKSFLFTVAKNLALGMIRRNARSPISVVLEVSASSVLDSRANVAEDACTREEVELLFAAIGSLSARTREVYLLRKFEGLSQKEIAALLGISPNTVEVHIGRANKQCEEFLRRHRVSNDSISSAK